MKLPPTSSTRVAAHARSKTALLAILLVLLTLAAFLPAIRAGFVWDDDRAIRDNALLDSSEGLRKIWAEPSSMSDFEAHYWPLVYTSFWVEHQLWGDDPRGYHAVNVLLHLANALLVWLVLLRLAVPGAWLAAALFAVHPVHVESVAWAIERKDVLSTLFYLLAFAAYLRFDERRRWGAWALSLALFGCALLSKSMTISFPLAVLLALFWKRGGIKKGDVLHVYPFLLVAAVVAFVDVRMASLDSTRPLDLGLLERVLVAGRALAFYAWKLVWPANLASIYPGWTVDASSTLQWLFPIGAAAVLVALWLARDRLGRGPVVAVAFFAMTLGPVLGFVLFSYMTYSYVADRFQYLASIGPLALAAAALARLASRSGVAPAMAAHSLATVLLCALGVLTWRQCGIYRDLESFWSYNLTQNPSSIAYSSLGDVYLRRGELEKAIEYQERSIALKDSSRGRFRLGEALMKRGEMDRALAEFQRGRELNQGLNLVRQVESGLCFNIGSIYWSKRDWAECVKYWEMAQKADPNLAEAKEWLSKARERLKNSPPPGSQGR